MKTQAPNYPLPNTMKVIFTDKLFKEVCFYHLAGGN